MEGLISTGQSVLEWAQQLGLISAAIAFCIGVYYLIWGGDRGRGKSIGCESPQVVQPLRQREVVEGDDRRHRVALTSFQHPPVVVELGDRELALGGLDACPLDAKSEGVHAEAGQHRYVVGVPVVEVAGIAGRLPAKGPFAVLPPPPIAVGIAALDLVGADRRAKEEAVWKGVAHQPECSTAACVGAAPNLTLDSTT